MVGIMIGVLMVVAIPVGEVVFEVAVVALAVPLDGAPLLRACRIGRVIAQDEDEPRIETEGREEALEEAAARDLALIPFGLLIIGTMGAKKLMMAPRSIGMST